MKQTYDFWVEREIGKCRELLKKGVRDVEKTYLEEYLKSLEAKEK